MSSSSTAQPAPAQPSVTAPERSPAALRAELDQLNETLRELKSTEIALRAYFETWAALVSFLAASKLIYDWHKSHAKPPILAIPVLLLGLGFLFDTIKKRRAQRALEREEQVRLDRQRELRELLGLNDAEFPSDSTTSNAPTVG